MPYTPNLKPPTRSFMEPYPLNAVPASYPCRHGASPPLRLSGRGLGGFHLARSCGVFSIGFRVYGSEVG